MPVIVLVVQVRRCTVSIVEGIIIFWRYRAACIRASFNGGIGLDHMNRNATEKHQQSWIKSRLGTNSVQSKLWMIVIWILTEWACLGSRKVDDPERDYGS